MKSNINVNRNLRLQANRVLDVKYDRIRRGSLREEIKPFVTRNQLQRSLHQRETYRLKQMDVQDNLAQIKARREKMKSAVIYKHMNLKNNKLSAF